MRFWDSSALVPLLVEEPATDRILELYQENSKIARRFLRIHTLRTVAAFVAAEHRPPTLEVVTLDNRLWTAAEHEGFQVLSV